MRWLPASLPQKPQVIWRKPLTSRGLGGVAATDKLVLVVDRDGGDTSDVFRCLRADNGDEVWSLVYPAEGNLDYGNSPRATPLIYKDIVIFFGAFGHLHGVDLASGGVLWELNLRERFPIEQPPEWGACSSPFIVDGKLIVNPGAKDASLVALDPRTGEVVWKCPGEPAAFGSLIAAEVGGRLLVIGHDKVSLGGWDPANGRRLWRLVPPRAHDFNVPTPIALAGRLLVTTENNGTRLYEFGPRGAVSPQPVASNEELAPDAHSPVVSGGKVFGVWNGLHCLDAATLKLLWTVQDPAFIDYASLVASPDRVLAISKRGELLLIDATADAYRLISRRSLFEKDSGVLSHPAFSNKAIFIRGSDSICRVELAP